VKSFYNPTSNYSDSNFGVQIPTDNTPGTVYVALQTPSQIDPAADTGYTLTSITMDYGSATSPTNLALYSVPATQNVTWSQPAINWSAWQLYAYPTTAGSLPPSYLTGLESLPNWTSLTLQYKVPVYPQVGDAVIEAVNGAGTVVQVWNQPTYNVPLSTVPPVTYTNHNDPVRRHPEPEPRRGHP
jgi:hypothetical protein